MNRRCSGALPSTAGFARAASSTTRYCSSTSAVNCSDSSPYVEHWSQPDAITDELWTSTSRAEPAELRRVRTGMERSVRGCSVRHHLRGRRAEDGYVEAIGRCVYSGLPNRHLVADPLSLLAGCVDRSGSLAFYFAQRVFCSSLIRLRPRDSCCAAGVPCPIEMPNRAEVAVRVLR
jgi:hypothetical protein